MSKTKTILAAAVICVCVAAGLSGSGWAQPSSCDFGEPCGTAGVCSEGGACLESGTPHADGNTQALQAELDAAAGTYRLPAGDIPISDPDGDGIALHLRSFLVVEAAGARLLVPPDVTGVRVSHSGSWSRMRDLWIEYTDPAAHSGVGVDVVGHGVGLSDAWVGGAGTGVRVTSNHKLSPTEVVNANSSRMRDVRIVGCHERGLWLEGSDANAGLFEGFDITNCGVGIYDDSFLGSVHVGHGIESGAVAIESVRAANYSTWVGTYVEGGPQIVAVGNLTTVGGNIVPRMPGSRVGYGFSRLTFREQVNGRDVRVTMPHAAGDSVMLVQHLGQYGDPLAWTLYHHPLTGVMGWQYNGVTPVQLLPDEGEFRARYRLGEEAP